MKKHFSKFRLMSILMCLIILVLAGFLMKGYLDSKSRREAAREKLRAEVQKGITENSFKRKVDSFLETSYAEAEFDARKCKFWVDRLYSDEYACVHLSMWNVDDRVEEWYEKYYTDRFATVRYDIKKPEQIIDFLNAITLSENTVKKVVFYIDPVKLYENYKRELYLDDGILTFPQEIRECILNYVYEHPDMQFWFNLPVYSAVDWNKKSEEEVEEALSFWNDFIFYSSWYNNVTVHALGTEEWLVVNRDSFNGYQMVPMVSETVFTLENTFDYTVDDTTVSEVLAEFRTVLDNDKKKKYSATNLNGRKVVFLGDSIFDNTQEDSLSIPGYLKAFSGADCYNLSIGGSTASLMEGNRSFSDVVDFVVSGNNGFPDGTRSSREYDLLLKTDEEDKRLTFVIEYGFNDYVGGLDVSGFKTSLSDGIKELGEKYPDAFFLLVSPLYTVYGNGGTVANEDSGACLKDYVKVLRDISEDNSRVFFVDMYNDSVINSNNTQEMLKDGVHPSFAGNLTIARTLAKKLTEIK